MKIVDRKTFLAMPPGTVFSKYEPRIFDRLAIKEKTWESGDYLAQHIEDALGSVDFNKTMERAERGESVPINFDCLDRDGLFEEEQLFAVWDKDDVRKLIERLQACL